MTKTRNVDAAVARARAVKAAKARTGAAYHLRKLREAAPTLTEAQLRQFAALVLVFAAGQPGDRVGGTPV